MVYTAKEDSYILREEIVKYIKKLDNIINENNIRYIKVLDMGSGTGIQAESCIEAGIDKKNILCVDIEDEAISLLKKKKLNAKKSDLFSNISKNEKFDLIIFNAPYLPEDKSGYDKGKDTTAGKRGNEIILKFLKQSKQHITDKGKIILLFSSLSMPEQILEYAEKLGYKNEKLAEKSLFFEKIFVHMFY